MRGKRRASRRRKALKNRGVFSLSLPLSAFLIIKLSPHLEEARRPRERRVADGAQLAVDRVDADLKKELRIEKREMASKVERAKAATAAA